MSVTFLRSHNNYLLIKDVTNKLTTCANVKYYKTTKMALLSYFQFYNISRPQLRDVYFTIHVNLHKSGRFYLILIFFTVISGSFTYISKVRFIPFILLPCHSECYRWFKSADCLYHLRSVVN